MAGDNKWKSLVELINETFSSNEVLKFYCKFLYQSFQPDISGYTLIFLIPPELSGYKNAGNFTKAETKFHSQLQVDEQKSNFAGSSQFTRLNEIGKFLTFAATDFTPPASSVNISNFSTRIGNAPYATEVNTSEQLTMNFIDNVQLNVYTYHLIWQEYIRDILDGLIEPDSKYIDPGNNGDFATLGPIVDYMGSAFIVKYMPDLEKIVYISKCIGVFPINIPSKEILGVRGQHELTTYPYTYSVAGFREATVTSGRNSFIFDEFNQYILSGFNTSNKSIQQTYMATEIPPDDKSDNNTNTENNIGPVERNTGR
jgi:hypothetical protein